jgi:uracil-DNA glycosylase family 4
MPLLSKPLACSGCVLYDNPQIGEKVGFSRPEGSGSLGVMIVGEALGESERRDGLPLRPYAASGAILERAFRRLGYDREQFVLWNMVACRPPNNKLEGTWYEKQSVEHCRRHFSSVVDRFRPKVIVGLGNVPLKYLTGMVGRNRTISMLRGFILPISPLFDLGREGPKVVVPSFHPAFLARGARNLIGVLARDIQLAVELSGRLAAGEEVKPDVGRYEINPRVSSLVSHLDFLHEAPQLPISYDIETDELERDATDESEAFGGRFGNITQIQFSWKPRQAVVCDWREPYIQFAKDIMALPNPKWGWNTWGYDDPRLEHYGIKINGESHDLMWGWHHLQPDIPRNLQFATSFYAPEMSPWKHTSGADLRQYGGADVDSVQRIGLRLFDDLQAAGIRSGYQRHIVSLWPVLKRMCQRGLPVNLEAREALRKKIDEKSNEIFAEIQQLVPLEVRGIHPTQGYKVSPSEVRALAAKEGIPLSGKAKVAILPESFKLEVYQVCRLRCREFDGVDRFYKEKDFLPNSTDQLKSYLRFKGIPVPTKLKERNDDGSPKETTEEKELERLFKKTKDPVVGKVREYRKLKKILSTYIEGWPVTKDGLVHSTFTFATATGQLSSRSPNIQNAPKHGELANEFNKTLWARPDFTIVSIDWTAFHALTLGYVARDIDYMRLARLDIHSYLAGHLLKLSDREGWLSLDDSTLSTTLARVKSDHKTIRDKKAKPTILGYGFGLGAGKLYDMNIESFDSKKEAQAIIDLLNSLFPRTAQFREDVKEEAAKQGLLRSPFGYLRRFNDVFSWSEIQPSYEPKWNDKIIERRGKLFKRNSGEEAEAAIAWKPANFAYGHAKEVVLSCEEKGYLEKYRLVNWVHDELRFECPNSLVDSCVLDISSAMESRSRVLIDPDIAPLGLACGVEASVGPNIAELETIYKTPLERII